MVKISDAEWQVMTVVWERAPVSTTDIVEALGASKSWHSRTTRTLLDRLVKKRAIKARQEGKRYLFEPLISMEQAVRHESRSFMDRVFGGEPVSMLLHLVEETKLSKQEIQKLKDILAKKEK